MPLKLPAKKKFRKNDHVNKYSPLPVPVLELKSKQCQWSFYTAEIMDKHLIVKHSGDTYELCGKGFFGKLVDKDDGFYSRKSKAEGSSFDLRHQKDNITEQHAETSKISLLKTTEDDSPLYVDNEIMLDCKNVNFYHNLHLSFCEGFFLSYALGCLFIKNGINRDYLSILQQWQFFCNSNVYFPIIYTAYHHFRSKGWVPKDGLRYGADFLLYHKGPPYYHASYLVIVNSVSAETLHPVQYKSAKDKYFSWESLSGLLRLATTVSKEVLFCSIAIPNRLLNKSKLMPDDIKNFVVHETILSRWVSSKEREKELFDIDCDF